MHPRWLAPLFAATALAAPTSHGATLRHHYRLDSNGNDTVGTAHLESKGNSVRFTASGGATGGYLTLGGSDDYLQALLADGSPLSILGDYSTFRPFSVSFWVRQSAAQATSGTQAVFGMTTESASTDTFNTGFEAITRESSTSTPGLRIRARQGGSGSDGGQIVTSLNVSDGQWHHVVAVYEAGSRAVYVDGVFRGGNNTPIAITTNPVSRFAIGALLRADSILDDFNGDIDDFQIYEGALSSQEVAQLQTHPGVTLQERPVEISADLSDVVDPLIGVFDTGSCVPGPCLPNGSIYPSPNTLTAAPGGYKHGSNVVGFAQLHPQGSGPSTMSFGNFLVSPQIGAGITEASHASPISGMVAHPYSFRARLDAWNTDCAIAAAANSAIYEFTFPSSTDARLYFDAARKQNSTTGMTAGSIAFDPATRSISGGGTFTGNWNPAPYEAYFYAVVDSAPASAGTFTGSTESTSLSASITSKQRLGGWMRFNTTTSRTVRLKIAVSFVSVAQAKAHLEREIPGWDRAGLESQAKDTWNRKLAVLQTPGISGAEARKLYTSLFHSLVQPRDRSADAAGRAGWSANAQFWDDQYTLWDTWQTLYPLLSITHPETVASVVNSFGSRFARNGVVETAFIQGKDFQVGQGGDEADLVIADAYAKQIPGIDWEKVWPVLEFNSSRRTADYRNLGYVSSNGDRGGYDSRMRSGSSTLAFAYEDWCTAQVAKGLGYTEKAAALQARSQNWKNVWDPSLTGNGFSGFVRAKASNGIFSTNSATSSSDFYQGTPWNYSFNVPHQRDEMIALMGGRARFLQRLQFAYEQNSADYIDFTNEPCFQTLWLFSHASRPYLSSYWADQLRQKYGAYSFTGDEDSGAMSSLYFFLTAGFFPIGGQDIYYLHGSRVPRLEFNLVNGKTFTITAENSGDNNLYIQSATLNGRPLTSPVIRHSDILAGSTLAFVMGPAPSTWGTGEDFNEPVSRELVQPLTGPWLSSGTTSGLSGTDSSAPSWRSGAAAGAIQTSFTAVTLGQAGDTLTLSAHVSFGSEATGTASRFAWGLFQGVGDSSTTGWQGYLAANDTSTAGSQSIWRKAAGNTAAFYATEGASALAGFKIEPQALSAGDYRLKLTLRRTDSGALDYHAALVRTADGVLVSAFTGSDPSPATYTFDRAGFRAGTSLGGGTLLMSECRLTASRSSYAGRELVIPEGAVFFWDEGDLNLAKLVNHGAFVLSGGSVEVTGALENDGVISMKGPGDLRVGGSFTNEGTIDRISSTGKLQATLTGSGVVLDLTSIRQSLTRNGPMVTFTLHAAKGHFYQLQKDASGALMGPWENIGEPFAGPGEPVSIEVEGEVDKVSGFFRVAVDP